MSFVEMSLAGAAMILVIALIRALAINRVPMRTFPVLWGAALMRLLIPFYLPSGLSVYKVFSATHMSRQKTDHTAFASADAKLCGTFLISCEFRGNFFPRNSYYIYPKYFYRRRSTMMKEKTVVCVGILLILAVLTSCALFYSVNDYSAVHDAPGAAYSGVSVMPAGAEVSISGTEAQFSY